MVNKNLYIHCSSSVANFRNKLEKRWQLQWWRWWMMFKPVIFFGMYHWGDLLWYLWARGQKSVIWCGSDIKNITPFRAWMLRNAKHYCENIVERQKLAEFGINAKVKQTFLEDPNNFEISFHPTSRPSVYLSMHKGREVEYGLPIVRQLAKDLPDYSFQIFGIDKPDNVFDNNIFCYGVVSPKDFNDYIKNFTCGLRLNEFDGFSEVIAKSVLMGQYPISRIPYDYIWSFETYEELLEKMRLLKEQKEPNLIASNYWRQKLNEEIV